MADEIVAVAVGAVTVAIAAGKEVEDVEKITPGRGARETKWKRVTPVTLVCGRLEGGKVVDCWRTYQRIWGAVLLVRKRDQG